MIKKANIQILFVVVIIMMILALLILGGYGLGSFYGSRQIHETNLKVVSESPTEITYEYTFKQDPYVRDDCSASPFDSFNIHLDTIQSTSTMPVRPLWLKYGSVVESKDVILSGLNAIAYPCEGRQRTVEEVRLEEQKAICKTTDVGQGKVGLSCEVTGKVYAYLSGQKVNANFVGISDGKVIVTFKNDVDPSVDPYVVEDKPKSNFFVLIWEFIKKLFGGD